MIRIGMLLSDRYEILEKIGSGGMSDVYKAIDHKLNRLVAIKVLKQEYSTDKNFVSKFWTEAQSAARLIHPNIVNVYDVGNDQGVYYIVMELVEGITLKKYIEKKGKLEIRESIGIAMQVCQGIEAAHEQKIIHRDIKPQNIIISKDGKVKVTDFGIARAASSQTISSNAMGSVHYISPEQARGGYCDERSDIYSLGIVMYEMLTGMVPFEGESTVQVALMHIQSEMVPPRKYEPMIPVSLEKIILKCTQKKPEARYSSVAALMADLRRALMTPDEDFVKMTPLVSSDDPTRIMSAEEVEQIKKEVGAGSSSADPYSDSRSSKGSSSRMVDEDEEAYLMGYEDEDDEEDDGYGDEDEDEDLDEEDEDEGEDTDPKFEKIITYVSIGVAVLIVILAVFIVGRAFGLFGGGSSSETETATVESTEDGTMTIMPQVVGLDLADAIDELTAAGLGYEIEEYEDNALFEDNQVTYQEYENGTSVARNTRVKLRVCDNSGYGDIPEGLVGSTYEAARRALLGAGFTPTRAEEYSDEVAEGYVISVDPDEGTERVAKDTTVTVTVSLGPESVPVDVPAVTGNSEATARTILENLGLVGQVERESSNDVREGDVIRQDPSSGTTMEEGSTVTIWVSTGSNQVAVPNLINRTIEDARRLLEERGLSLSSNYDQAYSGTITTVGNIVSQSIDADTMVDPGTSITVTLSLGPEPTTEATVTVPTLSGSQAEIEAAIRNVGLVPSVSTRYDSSAAGTIISQSPAAGTAVAPGTTVTVVVSLGPEPTPAETPAESQETETPASSTAAGTTP